MVRGGDEADIQVRGGGSSRLRKINYLAIAPYSNAAAVRPQLVGPELAYAATQ